MKQLCGLFCCLLLAQPALAQGTADKAEKRLADLLTPSSNVAPMSSKPAAWKAPKALGEPAFEASVDAALKAFKPVRDRPVPFTPLNLPDPFENLRYGQLRNPPDENAMPPAIPLQKPAAK